ncbi:hypothetical protein F1880_003998 [Penicillium rolfsii]|nr:hypothetical protein F1880_003998 [Penicillium rolfsii]
MSIVFIHGSCSRDLQRGEDVQCATPHTTAVGLAPEIAPAHLHQHQHYEVYTQEFHAFADQRLNLAVNVA